MVSIVFGCLGREFDRLTMAALAVEPLSVRVCLLGGGLPDLMVEPAVASLWCISPFNLSRWVLIERPYAM